jgi:hypothetical protein
MSSIISLNRTPQGISYVVVQHISNFHVYGQKITLAMINGKKISLHTASDGDSAKFVRILIDAIRKPGDVIDFNGYVATDQ